MNVYNYSLSSFAQWSSMDHGYVLAKTEQEAKQLAGDHIKQQYDKVNLLLKGVANFYFNEDLIEITLSKQKSDDCFNYDGSDFKNGIPIEMYLFLLEWKDINTHDYKAMKGDQRINDLSTYELNKLYEAIMAHDKLTK
jgi:uncharacterized protein YneR